MLNIPTLSMRSSRCLVDKETKFEQNGSWLALTCFYSRLQLLKFLSHSSQENVVQLMLPHFLVSNSYTLSLSTASALKQLSFLSSEVTLWVFFMFGLDMTLKRSWKSKYKLLKQEQIFSPCFEVEDIITVKWSLFHILMGFIIA